MGRNCLVSRNIGVILGDGPLEQRPGNNGERLVVVGQEGVQLVDIGITASASFARVFDVDHLRRGDIHRQFPTVQAPIHLLTPVSTSWSHPDRADVSHRPSFLLDSSSNRASQNRYPKCTLLRPHRSVPESIETLTIAGRRRSQITPLPPMDNGHVCTDAQGCAGEEGVKGILGLVSKQVHAW